jgi:hypothetical protein
MLTMFLGLALLATVSSSFSSAENFGVSAGDWVRYRAVREGPGDMAWTGDWYINTKSIRVEVLSVLDTNVTFLVSKYQRDGTVCNSTNEYDVASSSGRYYHYYFVFSNLSVGDVISFPRDDSAHAGPLQIGRIEQKLYNGANRTVCIAEFNYTSTYFGDIMVLYESYCWDQKTGFLLEQTAMTCIPSMGNLTSKGGLLVEKTSLWSSDSDSPPMQLMAVGAFIGLASVATIGLIVVKREKIRGWLGEK